MLVLCNLWSTSLTVCFTSFVNKFNSHRCMHINILYCSEFHYILCLPVHKPIIHEGLLILFTIHNIVSYTLRSCLCFQAKISIDLWDHAVFCYTDFPFISKNNFLATLCYLVVYFGSRLSGQNALCTHFAHVPNVQQYQYQHCWNLGNTCSACCGLLSRTTRNQCSTYQYSAIISITFFSPYNTCTCYIYVIMYFDDNM